MPTVQIEAHLSREQLLQAVRQLPPVELEEFTHAVLALRAHQRAPAVSATETDLLLKINEGLPEDDRQRYGELIARRQAETLTAEEQGELVQLGETVERREVERLQALVELAVLRQTTLDGLMKDLMLAKK